MSSSTSDNESDETSDRPNIWKGKASTWETLTEQERGLAASLDQIRNQDLSIHLYNAYALKKRALLKSQKPRDNEGQDTGTFNGSDADDEGEGWAPPKSWTAWPLPPDLVPREGEHIGPEDKDDAYTFKRREIERPSRGLEEVMMGIAMKQAKERFEAREWSDEYTDTFGTEGGLEANVAVKEGSQPPKATVLIPVVSADDDRSRQLLRPSIRSKFQLLEKTLMNLNYTIDTCRQYASHSEATSGDETDARRASRGPGSRGPSSRASSVGSKRKRGRPRYEDLASPAKVDSRDGTEEPDARLMRVKTTRRGRPLKSYPHLEGENEKEYLVRIARIQKKPLPKFSESSSDEDTPGAKISLTETPSKYSSVPYIFQKIPVQRSASEKNAKQRQKKQRLIGWSELLGAAAISGCSPEVIARATQRCVDLFGESMTMRTLVETRFDKNKDFETLYAPEKIPDIPSDFNADTSDSEMEGGVHIDGFLKPIRYPKRSTGKRDYSKERRRDDVNSENVSSSESEESEDEDEQNSSST